MAREYETDDYVAGAELTGRLIELEASLAKVEGKLFGYSSTGSFRGMAGSERLFRLFQRVSSLEGSPPPEVPDSWTQGRSLRSTLDGLQARIDALSEGGGPPEPEVEYPLIIFDQLLDEAPDTANNWSTRSIVQVSSGSGPQSQVRVWFEAAPNKDFRINNASIGISIMESVNDAPENGATRGIPRELLPLGGYKTDEIGLHWYVLRGSKAVTDWIVFPAFVETDLLVVVIDHNNDTGNPTAKSGLGAFPAAGAVRQAYQAGARSYNSNQGLSDATDGVLWGVTRNRGPLMEPIRIFVGTAANNEDLESQAVLEYTLTKYASQPLVIEWMMQSRDPDSFWHGWNTQGWATPFSGFRWGVPARCNFEGRAIYLDSDMIVMDDIAKLWNKPLHGQCSLIAKGSNKRFCTTLFDCAKVKPLMLPLKQLRTKQGIHREQRELLAQRSIVQPFTPDENWNCLDGETYDDILDPRIKIHHYTAIDCQPQLKYALPRLKALGQPHWFKGSVKPHWRQDLVALFDQTFAEASAAGYRPEAYQRAPYGDYAEGGSQGGAWVKGRPQHALGR